MKIIGGWVLAVLAVVATGFVAAGCSSSPAKPVVGSADVTACHAFGDKFIANASSTTTAERLQVLSQMATAQNANLRKEAAALTTAIKAQNNPAQLSATANIARTCYNLGLINRSGQPV